MKYTDNEARRIKRELDQVREQIEHFELDPEDYEDDYREQLDEDGPITVAGIRFGGAEILEALDGLAYRIGLDDYVDRLDKEVDPEYKRLKEKEEELDDELATALEEMGVDQLDEEEEQ